MLRGRSRREFVGEATRLGVGVAAWASMGPFASRGLGQVAAPSAVTAPPVEESGGASLAAHAAARGLLYGSAVNMRSLADDSMYVSMIREQCGILVAENAMKWGALRPSVDTFQFDQADALMAFAEAHHMKVRGHNLAWHEGNPKWFDAEVTAANARRLLVTHIETVMGRYAGRMHSWDVVNEAINVKDGRPDGMRDSVWLRMAGEDYVDLAFRTARSADPKTLLTYNEFGIEGDTVEDERKRSAVIAMLRRMVARKVPVDAVGVQSHISARCDKCPSYGAGLMRFIAAARELGLQVLITEMDVNDTKLAEDRTIRDAAVAAAYKQYIELVLSDPAVRAVLTWGMTDRYSWLNHSHPRTDAAAERPLPFDSSYHAKQAFFAIRDAFDARAVRGDRRAS